MTTRCQQDDCPFDGKPLEANKWHIDRKISLEVLVAFAGLLLTWAAYATAQAKWQGQVETRVTNLEEADKRIVTDQKTQKDEQTARMIRIEDKLDRALGRK